LDTQSAEQPEFRFLQGKTILFSSICQPSAMTTVFVVVKTDFIGNDDRLRGDKVNLHGGEDGRHGKVLRTSWRKGWKRLLT
jgi:hypothetical protein